jgi:uncharacterized membrane protein
MSKSNKNLKICIRLAVVAAIYVALTLVLYPLSFGAVQFRISEALMMLVSYNPIYSISLIIGCLIANLASPMGVIDIVFGTMATAIAILPMLKIKNKYISSLMPSIANAIIIGLELKYAYQLDFMLSSAQVFLGEFVVVTLIGVPLFKSIEKNKTLNQLLNFKNMSKETKLDSIFNKRVLLTLSLSVIGIVMFFKLGAFNITVDDNIDVYSLSRFTFDIVNNKMFNYLIVLLIFPILNCVSALLLNKKTSAIVNIILNVICIVILIIGMVDFIPTFKGESFDFRFVSYFVYYAILIAYEILTLKRNDEEIKESNDTSSLDEINMLNSEE